MAIFLSLAILDTYSGTFLHFPAQFKIDYVKVYEASQLSSYDRLLPNSYKMYQNYPNPFNPITTFDYNLPDDAKVNITIYDIMARVVNNLVSSHQTAGYKSIQWDARNNAGQPVSAGVYLYRIEAEEFRQTRKMVLLK